MSDEKKINSIRVKPIFSYLKDSFKFYDLDNSSVAQIVFIIELAIIFGGYIILTPFYEKVLLYFEQATIMLSELEEVNILSFSMLDSQLINNLTNAMLTSLGIILIIKAVTYIVGLFYGAYYYYSLTNPETTFDQRRRMFFQRFLKIIIFNVLFYFVFALGSFTLLMVFSTLAYLIPSFLLIGSIIPFALMAIHLLFMFKNLLIIEFDVDIAKNFKNSLDITKGCKGRIISNGLFPFILTVLVQTLATDIKTPILALFIVAFFEVIIILFSKRLITLMFIDAASLKRRDIKPEKDTQLE